MRSALIAIAGLGGAVGTTLSAGVCLPPCNARNYGLATESPLIKRLGCSFLSLDSFVIDGWDLRTEDLLTACSRHRICPPEVLLQAEERLRTISPRKGVDLRSPSIGDWIRREAEHICTRRERESLDHAVVVNLCPTEPLSALNSIAELDWTDLDRLSSTQVPSASAIYFRLAIEAGAHFINFTPNAVEAASLRELAESSGLIYAGRDGKTGQTFIKTTLAPAFRDRNLRIDGWFSTNLLGNDDGRSLAGTDAGKSKILSKSKGLKSILGYEPGGEDCSGHQVHIHYYPPRGDSKEAWDNIDFSGFLGVSMQMKINWLGQDSILAAPAVIDLVRLTAFAADAGYSGPLAAASYFFKDPVVRAECIVQHSVPDQFKMLLDFIRRGADS